MGKTREFQEIISHTKEQNGTLLVQSNDEHSAAVARLCEKFASDFGMQDLARIIGLLHDKGKERHSFQRYIRGEATPGEHNHAWVGGVIACKLCGARAWKPTMR